MINDNKLNPAETGAAGKNATKPEVILQVEHLSVWVRGNEGEIPIIHDISFELKDGERWGIAGESGAGKSMTMNAITALLPQGNTRIEGNIRYRQADGSWLSLLEIPYKKRHAVIARLVAIIFQDSINALNPNERILKQWGETVRLHRPELNQEDLLAHLLERMEIFGVRGGEKTLHMFPDQCSGGMRQRIAIAMALESPARILIADEPTTSLDAITQRSTVDFIRSLLDRSGRTLIYISHNLGILQYICDHIMVLRDGRIVEQGTAAEVFGNPQAPYTQELIRETRKILGKETEVEK